MISRHTAVTGAVAAAATAVILAGAFVIATRPPPYEADTTLFLLPPKSIADNPYSYFPKAVTVTAGIVVQHMAQPQERASLRARGATDDYQLFLQNAGNQWVPIFDRPAVTVMVTGPEPGSVNATMSAVTTEFRSTLDALQAKSGAPANARILASTVNKDAATVAHGRRSRALLAFLVASIWAAAIVGGRARRIIERRFMDPAPA